MFCNALVVGGVGTLQGGSYNDCELILELQMKIE